MGNMLTATQLMEDTSIASRAMKAVLHRGNGAGNRNRDKAAEQLVKEQFGDQGQIVTRKLFANKAGLIARRNQLANEMYAYHMRSTLPHGDDGSRLLPNSQYFEYTTKMASYEAELQRQAQYIVDNWDDIVDADMTERNAALTAQGKPATASAADYPTAGQAQALMYITWRLEPISTAADFRYDVAPEVKARLDEQLVAMQEAAKEEIFGRMLEPMSRFVKKLSVPIDEKGSVFRNSLVENLNELLADLPKMNFDGDPRVEEALAELRQIITPYVFNPDTLRQDGTARSEARRKMEELQKKLEGYSFGSL